MKTEQAVIVKNNNLILHQKEELLPIIDIKKRADHIHAIMRDLMQKDVHYGIIPGCGTKPALFKAGAEKILMGFQLAAEYEITELSTDKFFGFRIVAKIHSVNTGRLLGGGIGDATTREKKWRHLFEAGNSNTVLKMAKVRALRDAILTVTAASDIFAQDIEDSDLEKQNENKENATKPETNKPEINLKLQAIADMSREMKSTEDQKNIYQKMVKINGVDVTYNEVYRRFLAYEEKNGIIR